MEQNLASTDAEADLHINGINGHVADLSTTLFLDGSSAWDEDADAVYEDDVYDDSGEGAGIEGDLDMEED